MSVKTEGVEYNDPTEEEHSEISIQLEADENSGLNSEHEPHESINNDDQSFESTFDRFHSQIYKDFQLEGIQGNTKIRFLKSNVGHPMLVVDKFAFHKHSINSKNGRINWRCSKRRVRGIRCSSSCYSMNGSVSEPSPHVLNCPVLSDNFIDNKYGKGFKITMTNDRRYRINLKADSFTTLKSKKLTINNCDEILSVQRNAPYDETFDSNPLNSSYISQTQSEVADDLNSLAESFNNENNWSDTATQGQDTISTETSPDIIYEESTHDNNIQIESDLACTSNQQISEMSLTESNQELKEPYLTLFKQFNELKNKQEFYYQNYKQAVYELDNYKKKTQSQIQSLTWKSKMSDIQITSLKSLLSQRQAENKCLKRLVHEMMSKLKDDEKEAIEEHQQ